MIVYTSISLSVTIECMITVTSPVQQKALNSVTFFQEIGGCYKAFSVLSISVSDSTFSFKCSIEASGIVFLQEIE